MTNSIQLTAEQVSENIRAMILTGQVLENVSGMIRNDYTVWIESGKNEGAAGLVALWQGMAEEGKMANIRTLFSRCSKQVHKELGIEAGALIVKDGELTYAATREKAGCPLRELANTLAGRYKGELEIREKLAAKLLEAAIELGLEV